jgi:hypothetical protein
LGDLISQMEGPKSIAKRGGRRPGAGRKPSTIRGIVRRLPKDTAELVLAEINANHKWVELARSKDERIVLEVLKYLTDRAYGRPRQSVEVENVTLRGAFERMSREELEAYARENKLPEWFPRETNSETIQ